MGCSVVFVVVGFGEEEVSDSKKLCMVGVYCGWLSRENFRLGGMERG